MENYQALITQAHLLVGAALLVLIAINIFLLWRAKKANKEARPHSVLEKIARGARLVAVVLMAAGIFFALTVLIPLAPLAANYARIGAFVLLALWPVLEFWRATRLQSEPSRVWLGVSFFISVIFAAVGVFLLRAIPAIMTTPEHASNIVLRPPFEGQWIAVHAGPSIAANHHVRIPEQDYAADFAMLGPTGGIRRGKSDSQEDFYSFGAPIVSPVDGLVVKAVDGHPDGVIPTEFEDIPGNHVAIQVEPGVNVLLAHFKQGSVEVREGQRVRAGQRIAQAGNSGNSDLPHLHIHVQDRPDVARGVKALPWSFGSVVVERLLISKPRKKISITRNDIVRSARP